MWNILQEHKKVSSRLDNQGGATQALPEDCNGQQAVKVKELADKLAAAEKQVAEIEAQAEHQADLGKELTRELAVVKKMKAETDLRSSRWGAATILGKSSVIGQAQHCREWLND